MLFLFLCSMFLFYLLFSHYRKCKKISNITTRHVFITGCGTGFGNRLARRLDELGVHVYAGCVLQSSADKLNEESSHRLKAFVIDVTEQSSIDNAYKLVEDELDGKPLWAIVNNAAIPAALVPFDWTHVDDYEKVLNVNLLGIIRTTLTFLPLVKRGKEGRIVNASSMNGRLNIMSNAYGISKCGLEALSNGLSFELKPFNITVHTLQPSIFKTHMSDPDFHTELILNKWDQLKPEIKKEYGDDYVQNKIANIKALYLKNTSYNLLPVIDAYQHALLAKYPHNRYIVGLDAKFLLLPLSWLPFPVLYFILPLIQNLAGLSEPMPCCCVKS